MTKKSIVTTLMAGIAFGGLVGLKVTLDVYDFGYRAGFKAGQGDEVFKESYECVKVLRSALADEIKSKKAKKN